MTPPSRAVDADGASASATLERDVGVTAPLVRIQLLHVPGCPNLGQLRRRVESVISDLGVATVIEEVEGPYHSPTLLVNGEDVTGRPLGSDPSCRLDIPTDEQITAAMRRISGEAEPIPSAATAPSSL